MSAEALLQFAASSHYNYHGHLLIKNDRLVYRAGQITPSSSSLKEMTRLAIETFKANPTEETKAALQLFNYFLKNDEFYPSKQQRQAVAQIDAILKTQEVVLCHLEVFFQLKFLADLPERLGVTYAPKTKQITVTWLNGETTSKKVSEWKIITCLSQKIYNSAVVSAAPSIEKKWKIYSEIMEGLYQGDHILIPDDPEHHFTQELIQLGAIVRTSSHYEKGRKVKGWNPDGSPQFGGALYKNIRKLKPLEHHWSLQGDHVHEILFCAVEMRKRKDGTLIYAKTARQVDHLIQAGKLNGAEIDLEHTYHFTALQFESAPNSEGMQLFDWNFWHHKLISANLYKGLKLMGYENANIGPYGYGKTDLNPRLL